MRTKSSERRLFEIVQLSIYDVGTAVDLARLEKAAAVMSAKRSGMPSPVGRDTPASLSLPTPLCIPLEGAEAEGLGHLSVSAKVYGDGAVTVIIRGKASLTLDELDSLSRTEPVRTPWGNLGLEAYSADLFVRVLGLVSPSVVAPVADEFRERKSYRAYCLLECPEGAGRYISERREKIAALLIGEEDEGRLHESQIAAALGRPFSYRPEDLAVFDMDRCFLVDPQGDYEDILLIAEHANYRLLELRALDHLLDSRLDEAERDLTAYGIPGTGNVKKRRRLRGRAPQKKFARIQALRFEALFILENLENSAKIIGDFYLGQIYERLCAIFNTDGWSRSVERRLDVLSSVYEMAKSDSAERRTLMLEIVFIVVCIVLPLVQIWQVLLLN